MTDEPNPSTHTDSAAATLERCCRLVDIEFRAVALQRRRLQTTEPEDESFDLRWWIDLQFFILALSRLQRVARLVQGTHYESGQVRSALASLEAATPSLRTMRNIGEHADEYAIDSPKRHEKTIDRRQLETGSWDGQTFSWLQKHDGTQHALNVDIALEAAQTLQRVLQETHAIAIMPSTKGHPPRKRRVSR